MRIRFVMDYTPYRPGQVVDYPHDGAADVLIRRGIARAVGGTFGTLGPPLGLVADTSEAEKALQKLGEVVKKFDKAAKKAAPKKLKGK